MVAKKIFKQEFSTQKFNFNYKTYFNILKLFNFID